MSMFGNEAQFAFLEPGDNARFTPAEHESRTEQIKLITKEMEVSEQFAAVLYDNGVMLDVKGLGAGSGEFGGFVASPIIDYWYDRRITWMDMEPPDVLGKISRRLRDGWLISYPLKDDSDKEWFDLKKAVRYLNSYAPYKEPFLDNDMPTPVWSARNREELEDVIGHIEGMLKDAATNARELWFRGQPQEYMVERNPDVVEWLGYPEEATRHASLMPALARIAKADAEAQTPRWASSLGPIINWRTAFMFWVFLHHKSWFLRSPEYIPLLENALITADFEPFSDILRLIRYDQLIGDADDFRQWFFAEYHMSMLPLICQHYGFPTSALDVTNSLDVALFFAFHNFDRESGLHSGINKSQSAPVLYVFARPWGDQWQTSLIRSPRIMESSVMDWTLPTPKRVERQQCGLLTGADLYSWNRYADRIIAKIRLDEFEDEVCNAEKTLFPDVDDDDLYGVLLRHRPELDYLVQYNFS